jgi:hypothetical protein
MRNKTRWYSILLIGLVLLLGASVVGCPDSTSQLLPNIVAFSATPNEISAGESATLLWNVTGVTTVSIDQGIGDVPAAGTKEVSPTTTTTYTLTATNTAGTITESTVITVGKNGELPAGAIWWYEAKDHIGDRLTVCGPVVDSNWASGTSGKPTFLNIGKPYPDPDRFTVVIWIDYRSNFPQSPEDYYLGKTICITGLITEYEGIAEIEAQSPTQIEDP